MLRTFSGKIKPERSAIWYIIFMNRNLIRSRRLKEPSSCPLIWTCIKPRWPLLEAGQTYLLAFKLWGRGQFLLDCSVFKFWMKFVQITPEHSLKGAGYLLWTFSLSCSRERHRKESTYKYIILQIFIGPKSDHGSEILEDLPIPPLPSPLGENQSQKCRRFQNAHRVSAKVGKCREIS